MTRESTLFDRIDTACVTREPRLTETEKARLRETCINCWDSSYDGNDCYWCCFHDIHVSANNNCADHTIGKFVTDASLEIKRVKFLDAEMIKTMKLLEHL